MQDSIENDQSDILSEQEQLIYIEFDCGHALVDTCDDLLRDSKEDRLLRLTRRKLD